MDEENPITDASNFHSAPEMGRAKDDENTENTEEPEVTETQETTEFIETPEPSEEPKEEPNEEPVATAIAVEEISETVTPEPVSEIPEEKPEEQPEEKPAEQATEPIAAESMPTPKVDNPSKILSQEQPYTTIEQSSRNMEQFQTAPKKKANLVATIVIVLSTVLVTALVVFLILKITQGGKSDNQITPSETTSEVTYSTITCTKEGDVNARVAVGDATKIETTVIASYSDDEMDDIAETTEYTYTDASAAKTGAIAVKDAYKKRLSDVGLRDIDDPFTTTYSLSGTILTETHFAEFDELSSENASVIGLTVDKSGEVATDSDSVKKTYKAAGFTCKTKSE